MNIDRTACRIMCVIIFWPVEGHGRSSPLIRV